MWPVGSLLSDDIPSRPNERPTITGTHDRRMGVESALSIQTARTFVMRLVTLSRISAYKHHPLS